jgi:hypothetical protein
MVITYSRTAGDDEPLSNCSAIGERFGLPDTWWQDLLEPMWQQARPAWFDIELPFLAERRTTTLVQVQTRVGEQPVLTTQDAAAKLRAFHDWLDSLPPVPHIPFEALDRDNLY